MRTAQLTVVGVLLLTSCFLGLARGLWTPDEPREAGISREMAERPGVIPTLNGRPFIEKPPLYYWLTGAALRIAGAPSAPAARAVSGVAAKHDASVATETAVPDEAYADWPGSYDPVRMPWPG